jgi:hypothetical protein
MHHGQIAKTTGLALAPDFKEGPEALTKPRSFSINRVNDLSSVLAGLWSTLPPNLMTLLLFQKAGSTDSEAI